MNSILIEEKLEKYNNQASSVIMNIVFMIKAFTLSIPFAYLYFTKFTDGSMYIDAKFCYSVSIFIFVISYGMLFKNLLLSKKEDDDKIIESKIKGLQFYVDKNYLLPTKGHFRTVFMLNLALCYLMYNFGGNFEYMAYAMCVGHIWGYIKRMTDFKKYFYLYGEVLK